MVLFLAIVPLIFLISWLKHTFGFIITKSNNVGFITFKGCAKGMRSASLNVKHHIMEIITERRDAMTKSSTPLNVDFLNILLSSKDEDDTITDDDIIGTLVVSYFVS